MKDIKIQFWRNSFEESGKYMLGPFFDFIKNLKTFNRDAMNGETI